MIPDSFCGGDPKGPGTRIATMCVTYGRPERALECFKSWKATQSGYTDFWLVVDENDPLKSEYGKGYDHIYGIITAPTMRRGMCDPSNYAAKFLSKDYLAIQFMADDFLYRTPGWDVKFLKQYYAKHRKIIWYGNDLLQGQNLPTSYIISSDIVLALGYICNPIFDHLYIDNWVKKLGEETGILVYDDSVIIEHMHPGAYKAQWDNNYLEVQKCEGHDRNQYQIWLSEGMEKEIALLKEIL